jgi:hypothetical protein
VNSLVEIAWSLGGSKTMRAWLRAPSGACGTRRRDSESTGRNQSRRTRQRSTTSMPSPSSRWCQTVVPPSCGGTPSSNRIDCRDDCVDCFECKLGVSGGLTKRGTAKQFGIVEGKLRGVHFPRVIPAHPMEIHKLHQQWRDRLVQSYA